MHGCQFKEHAEGKHCAGTCCSKHKLQTKTCAGKDVPTARDVVHVRAHAATVKWASCKGEVQCIWKPPGGAEEVID